MDFSQIPNPCFVIDQKKLFENVEKINYVAQNADVEIILAFKATALWKALDTVKHLIPTATASSVYEAMLCNELFHKKAHTYCVAIDDNEIDTLLELSSHITFNSLNQLEKYKNKALEKNVSIGIRVNPQYSEVKTELYNPASPYSRLGCSPELFRDGLPDGVEGLHFHVLCENNSYALENVLKAFESKFGHLLKDIKWLNMGGGHLITHKEYNIEHLISILKNFKQKYPHLQIILEPGAAFVWQTGYLVAKVLDIVDNYGVKTAILNVSFTAHMPDTLEMPYKPNIIDAIPDKIENMYHYRLGGNSCLAGDYLSEYSFKKPLKIGDLIVFEDMIHYTIVKTTMFNGVHHPSIGMWTIDNKFVLFREFTYDDYKNRMS